MKTYILPHLGLGDYLMVNGLIRNIVKKPGDYVLVCNKLYAESIRFMFRDLTNLTFLYVPPVEMNYNIIRNYIIDFFYDVILIGYHHLDNVTKIDEMFYKQFGLDFEKRWSDFYVERDPQREKELFDKFDVKEGEYIIIHEDPSRNQFIDRSLFKSKLKVVEIKPGITKNIFDYCYLIENAAEAHCIDSAFLFLFDSINTKGNLFTHRYARGLYDSTTPNLKKNWTVYKLKYKDAIRLEMEKLAKDPKVVFMGYNVKYGSKANGTLINVPDEQLIETPVAENLMLSSAIGMSMEGFLPVVYFERFNFILNALDSIVNHLDKIEGLSHGEFKPKLIIRAVIGGSKQPFFTGITHTQDFTEALKNLVDFDVVKLPVGTIEDYQEIKRIFVRALESNKSTLIIEEKDEYETILT
jgi:hypothetical protein